MDDNCAKFKVWMTIVESGWNVWVWLVGVGGIYGCGYWVYIVVRRYIDFLILFIPTPLVSVLFTALYISAYIVWRLILTV